MLLMTQFIVGAEHGSTAETFVERVYRMRTCAFGLGFVCLASVLSQLSAHPLTWALLAANAFGWPHLARLLTLRSRDPANAETRNLLIDSAMGGVWIMFMQFNLLPSVLIALILAVDKMNFGGWRLLMRGIAVQLAACVLAAAIHGLGFAPQTTMLNVLASLPLLITYPLVMSASAYSLSRTVRDQNRQLMQLHHAGLDR
jgi:diguanylate cyclase